MIRFGIIGTNTITDTVFNGARQEPRFVANALYSRTEERANFAAAKYNIKHTFTSLEQMAASDLIDAVYIASPNAFHAEQAMTFMNHGKHVLCEKAFASNYSQAKEMVECAKRNNVALMEAMKPTVTPNFRSVMENIEKISPVTKYFSSYCQYSSRYDKFKNGIIENAFKPELSNGATTDIGVYAIYPMVLLFGMPKEIYAVGTLLSTGVDASASVVFKYDTIDCAVNYSKISDGTLPTQIIGEKGTITLDRINIISNVNMTLRGSDDKNISKPTLNDEYYYEVCEFIDLIESGKISSEINSHEVSLNVMKVLDTIREQLGVTMFA